MNRLKVYLTKAEIPSCEKFYGKDFQERYEVIMIFTPEQFEILENMRERLINASWTSNKKRPLGIWDFHPGK